MLLEAVGDGGSGSELDDDEGDCLVEGGHFRVGRMNFCPTLIHTKLLCSDEGNYSVKHLISGEQVKLKVGAEYEIRHAVGLWRLQEAGVAELGTPLSNLFVKQLRFNETLSFIELFNKKRNARGYGQARVFGMCR